METDVCMFHDFCLWGEKHGCGNGQGYICPAARQNPQYLRVKESRKSEVGDQVSEQRPD